MPQHSKERRAPRLAVDIGGTFTDIAIESDQGLVTAKTPTTPADPVEGVVAGIALARAKCDLAPADFGAVIHGTTLATNALIEKKGARVGLVASEGFRDILEIAYERRYDQYDLFIDKPDMLVPRERCFTVPERVDARGEVLRPLAEAAVEGLLAEIESTGVESLAICLLHAYAKPLHEERLAALIAARRPDLALTLSSEVCPEIREFDRACTAVANAYIQPLMARYLTRLAQRLDQEGYGCPLFVVTSGGGMTTLETACRLPIRLVESGPSGGAILAAAIARQGGHQKVVSFDMGGTTAKLCLIDDGTPQGARQFEIARARRFMKGSGLPVRIPVIEMIEIGAGGGSMTAVDGLGLLTVGPQSAGAEPGPACYGRGGGRATVTDCDALAGYIDPETFAEGRLRLDLTAAEAAIARDLGTPLELPAAAAADAATRVVEENMANAGRIHAVERGKALEGRTLIAFGGNGPLHASRLAEKLGIDRVLVPPDPGVGSAVGFLIAPVSFEVVRSFHTPLEGADPARVNALLSAMTAAAEAVVVPGAPGVPLACARRAFMRYQGQGHEIEVPLPDGNLQAVSFEALRAAYEARYSALYGRSVPGMAIEVLNWAVTLHTQPPVPRALDDPGGPRWPLPGHHRPVHLRGGENAVSVPCFHRPALAPGDALTGPALIYEAQTTTFIGSGFSALIDGGGSIVMERQSNEVAA